MDSVGYRLGVDFGTSNTVAMLAWPDGHVRPLLFDGSPTLPSAVYADEAGGLLVGRDAMHAARIGPERYEPNPKRRIDEPAVLLGDREIATVDLIAAVLGRVAGEARRVTGGVLGPATVTCPAAWAQTRRGVLLAAARRAGLGEVTLVPEPVAAAQVFLTLPGQDAPRGRPGPAFVVYDLGAGTFDASVVRHAGEFFEVLATEGLNTSGGLDIDAAIVAYLGASNGGQNPEAWGRLAHPSTSAERRAHRMLWDDVRSAKEILSRTASTMIHVPPLDADVPLGRDQFEQLARPILTATVTATRAAVAAAGLGPGDVGGVFLVGGGSRIPLVATMLHQALGKAPTVVEQPELVVAQGAVGASAQFTLPSPGGVAGGGYGGGAGTAYASGSGAAYAGGSGPYPAPVSGVPVSGMPVSGTPSSGGGLGGGGAVAPVSPGLLSAPVTGSPAGGFPATGSPVGGSPAGGFPATGSPVGGSPAGGFPVGGSPVASPGNRAVYSGGAGGAERSGPAGGRIPAGPAGVGPTGGGRAASGGAAGGGAPAERRRGKGVIAAAVVILVLVLGLGAWGVVYAIDKLGGGSGDDGSGQGTHVTADLEHPDVDWSSTAEAYDNKPGTTIGYQCPASGTIITVWGSGPYTTDSSVCTAAVHAGKITLDDGGRVVIKIVAGPSSYEGTTRHDIVTVSYGEFAWAYEFVG
ncbi:Hsp70 family protein [Dactylosporangium salmoneum]|uniref:Hsp70 family protein n=1 Tax=Dactylosporangium salmoneum TaxID=53361 RepID=UPI0031DB55AC